MKRSDKLFILPVLILGVYFLIRLINQSRLLFIFPLDYGNDFYAHVAQLHFLLKYGYHNLVPNWYNGFELFKFYPPGWYFLTLPFYWLIRNPNVVFYFSIILMFGIIFVALYHFGKNQGFSFIKILTFFLFIFANPIAIGNYIRLGRVSELFALVCLIILSCLILSYKNRKINWRFSIAFLIFYFLLIIGHPSVAFVFHVLLLGFFIILGFKDKLKLIGLSILGILASSFWWLPFILGFSKDMARGDDLFILRILSFSEPWLLTSLATFVVFLIFILTFYFYWDRSKRELYFYLPLIITVVLFVTRLIIFIPILNRVYADVYMIFFLFFSTYFLLKMKIPIKLDRIFMIGLIFIAIISISISHYHTPYFIQPDQHGNDTLEILKYVKGRVAILGSFPKAFSVAFYSYGAINYDLYTHSGGNNFGTMNKEYKERLDKFKEVFHNKDCKIIRDMEYFNVTEIITYDANYEEDGSYVHHDYCGYLVSCGLKEVKRIGNVCLIRSEDYQKQFK